jgi:hypothetical protein
MMEWRTHSNILWYEEWSEVIITKERIIHSSWRNIPPAVVDDPLFRKALVTTSRMGQTAVCMGRGTTLGKRDTTLPHRHTFSRTIIGKMAEY